MAASPVFWWFFLFFCFVFVFGFSLSQTNIMWDSTICVHFYFLLFLGGGLAPVDVLPWRRCLVDACLVEWRRCMQRLYFTPLAMRPIFGLTLICSVY